MGWRGSKRSIGDSLKTYLLYIHDDRYATPTLDVIVVADDSRAREIAASRLSTSSHYRRAEIWEDERPVGEVEKPEG
jgi:hypothetical protein